MQGTKILSNKNEFKIRGRGIFAVESDTVKRDGAYNDVGSQFNPNRRTLGNHRARLPNGEHLPVVTCSLDGLLPAKVSFRRLLGQSSCSGAIPIDVSSDKVNGSWRSCRFRSASDIPVITLVERHICGGRRRRCPTSWGLGDPLRLRVCGFDRFWSCHV